MEKYVMILLGVAILGVCWQSLNSQVASDKAPQCFNTTTCPCCSVPCPSDGSGQCGGRCLDGYHGGKCYNRCPNNCVRCVDAQNAGDGVSNCLLCKDGFYSTPSLYQCQSICSSSCKTCESMESYCTSCPIGFFVTERFECSKCNQHCESCISLTNCTSCKLGFYVDRGDGTCHKCNAFCNECDSLDNCYCYNGCNHPNTCNDLNECNFGCKANFTSTVGNNLCNKCIDGNYGIECNLQCSNGCTLRGCYRANGTCVECNDGFQGDICTTQCPVNCKAACDKVTGFCASCNDGFYGPRCDQACVKNCSKCLQSNGSCTICTDGFYGINCTKSCPPRCINGCNISNGHCKMCVAGFTGIDCNSPTTTPFSTTTVIQQVIKKETTHSDDLVAGGTSSVVIVIVIVVVLAVFLFRRRSMTRFKGNLNMIKIDEYHLTQTDVLEENDEFDPTYFTRKAVDKKKPCGKLLVRDLAQYVSTHGEDFFQEEFLKLPRGLIKPCDDAKLEENLVKNRYTGIYPYDEHRVKLLPPGSDFINACYIDYFKTKREYIASLGPTRKAMEGFQLFWRLVWQEKSDVIVMVTNLMEGQSLKCEQYWPDVGSSVRYCNIDVTTHSEDFYSEFIVRKMKLSMGSEYRVLNHLHYTAWPDKQVPDDVTSLIEFRQKVKATVSLLGGPTIVHCSAGIGRTGTYIAMDILIHQGKAHKSLDIFEWVTRMREQRTSMVQTWQQYEFLHRALVHALTFHCEPIREFKFLQFLDSLTDKRLKTLFKQLTKPVKLGDGEEEAKTINKSYDGLNREGADIPGSLNRPLLHLEKKFGECNYINAVYVNSYTIKDRFLVCQTPLPDTVKDFLTLILQENCSCIVSMDPPGLKDPTIGEYFFRSNNASFILPPGLYEVETHDLDNNPSYILRKLIIQHNQRSGSTTKTVYHYQCHHWPHVNRIPDVSHFLQLVQDVGAMNDKDSGHRPVLVHCLNAAGRSGLFCAVSNLVQKIKVEGEVSVVNTLRQVKVRRTLAIPNKEQVLFCYKAVQQFLNLRTKTESDGETAIYCNV